MTLLIAPVFDDVTKYSVKWANNIKSLLKNLTVLDGRPITRAEVESALIGKSLLAFYDHGNEYGLYGSVDEQVIDEDNIDKLPLMVYTMACLSAKDCGVKIWRSGRTFWGYHDVFSFTTDALPEFEQMANSGIILVSQGKTWSEAYDSTIQLGNQLSKSLADKGDYVSSVVMDSDVKALRLYDSTHSPTESTCPFRTVALKLFGGKGWNLRSLGRRKEMVK